MGASGVAVMLSTEGALAPQSVTMTSTVASSDDTTPLSTTRPKT